MDDSKHKIVSLKNLTDGQCLTLKGPGEFRIGLTAEDQVVCVGGEGEGDGEGGEMMMGLVVVTVWRTEGTTVAPAGKDLPCLLNGATITTEANLLPGSVIEVGDRQLEFHGGPVPRPRRRCLPPTPGVPLLPQPPPKPQRSGSGGAQDQAAIDRRSKPTPPLSVRRPPPLPNNWALIELPATDAELLKQTRKPEQLAGVVSSYLAKHIHLHTDARITAELTDQIFSAMLEVAHHGRHILQRFLTDLMEEQAKAVADNDDHLNDRTLPPSHAAVIVLLRDILRQFLDPQTLAVVSLVMLRALSHVPGATQSLVDCQLTSAILGTMAALKAAATVQQYCLDVLAKIALYHPSVSHKAPLRESATDLICLSLDTHPSNLTVAQGACRTLANLATTLYTVLSHSLDHADSGSEEHRQFVSGLLAVLDYVFSKSLPCINDTLKRHGLDLTIKTDGRRFLFVFAKLQQLRQRKDQWLTTPPSAPPPLPPRPPAPTPPLTPDDDVAPGNDYDDDLSPGNSGKGIMKRSRSFENLRTPERKVTFDEEGEEGEGGQDSCSSPSPTPHEDAGPGGDNPIQILAQRVIPVAQFTDSSPDTPTAAQTTIGQPPSADCAVIGCRPDAEGSDSPFNDNVEYENWDLLRGVLQRRSGLQAHRYCSGDLTFMARLTKTQVVALVCALAVEGRVREALSVVDEPLSKVVGGRGEVPPGVRDFVWRQYSTSESLMDLDPGLLVSLIDAVRYKSLSYQLAQQWVLSVVRALDDQQQAPVVAVTVEFLAATITHRSLAPAMTVPSFVLEVCGELQRAVKVSHNAPALRCLLEEIRLCANKITPCHA